MEGLELKHYLDAFKYKVPCRLSRTGLFNLDLEYPDHRYNEIGVIMDLSTSNDGNEISGSIKLKSGVSADFDFKLGEEPEIELIYRPLSDLTKEIEINGEKFVPKDKFYFKNMSRPDYIIESNMLYGKLEIGIYEKLLEWHFDLYGLIKKGLAIDINTL